jgi:WXG100 protein secretion system (Wss), protein YukD
MASIDVVLTDATGSRKQEASLPSDAPSIRVMARLLELMKLPVTGPDGQPVAYKFHHVQTGRQLRDEATLNQSGVKAGDTLRIVPEITAG